MRLVSETKAIEKLEQIRANFRSEIATFEVNADSCSTCSTPGACCLDAHFVNVRISRLEAAAIAREIKRVPVEEQRKVAFRIRTAIEKFRLDGASEKTYACPLYENGRGCLVHDTAKPLPCIAHACYEKRADLPLDALLEAAQVKVAELNHRVYPGSDSQLLSIPLALARTPQLPAQNCHRDQSDDENKVIPNRGEVPYQGLDRDAYDQE